MKYHLLYWRRIKIVFYVHRTNYGTAQKHHQQSISLPDALITCEFCSCRGHQRRNCVTRIKMAREINAVSEIGMLHHNIHYKNSGNCQLSRDQGYIHTFKNKNRHEQANANGQMGGAHWPNAHHQNNTQQQIGQLTDMIIPQRLCDTKRGPKRKSAADIAPRLLLPKKTTRSGYRHDSFGEFPKNIEALKKLNNGFESTTEKHILSSQNMRVLPKGTTQIEYQRDSFGEFGETLEIDNVINELELFLLTTELSKPMRTDLTFDHSFKSLLQNDPMETTKILYPEPVQQKLSIEASNTKLFNTTKSFVPQSIDCHKVIDIHHSEIDSINKFATDVKISGDSNFAVSTKVILDRKNSTIIIPEKLNHQNVIHTNKSRQSMVSFNNMAGQQGAILREAYSKFFNVFTRQNFPKSTLCILAKTNLIILVFEKKYEFSEGTSSEHLYTMLTARNWKTRKRKREMHSFYGNLPKFTNDNGIIAFYGSILKPCLINLPTMSYLF